MRSVPKDQAILVVHCTPEARLEVNGRDRGTAKGPTREIIFRDLSPQRPYRTQLKVSHGGDNEDHRLVLLTAGSQTETVFDAPDAARPLPVVQRGHVSQLNAVAFSPDGKFVLTGGDDNIAVLWESESGQQLRTFHGLPESVEDVEFFPDGLSVGINYEEAYRIFDRDTGERLFNLSPSIAFGDSAISPDGRYVALADYQFVSVFDRSQGKFTNQVMQPGNDARVRCIAWSPDGGSLAIGGDRNDRGFLELWNPVSAKLMRRYDVAMSRVSGLCFSPDGAQLASGQGGYSQPGQLFLWDAATGKILRNFAGVPKGNGEVHSLAFSPDGSRLIAATHSDKNIWSWDVRSGRLSRLLSGSSGDMKAGVTAAAMSRDGELLLTGTVSGVAALLDAQTGQRRREFRGRATAVTALATSPDGGVVAIGAGKRIVLWDLKEGLPKRIINGQANHLQFDASGSLMLAAEGLTSVLWDVTTGQPVRTFGGLGTRGLAFADRGRLLLAAQTGSVQVLDAQDGRLLRTIPLEALGTFQLSAAQTGARFAIISEHDGSGHIAIWNATTGNREQQFEAPTPMPHVELFEDGRILLAGNLPGEGSEESRLSHPVVEMIDKDGVRQTVWTGTPGTKLTAFAVGEDDLLLALAIQSEGLAGAIAGDVIVWNLQERQVKSALQSPAGSASALVFASGGEELLGLYKATANQVVRWNLAAGSSPKVVPTTIANPSHVAAGSASNEMFVAGAANGRADLGLFDVDSGRRVRTFAAHATANVLTELIVSGSARRMVTAAADELILWDTVTGARVQSWPRNGGWTSAAALSPDGRRALVASHGLEDRAVRLWNAEDGQLLRTFRARNAQDNFEYVAFSPDGSRILAGASTKYVSREGLPVGEIGDTVFVWDAASGRELLSLADKVAVQFDSAGERILTEVGSWLDASRGNTVLPAPGHTQTIQSIAVSADGKWAVTGGWDNRAIVWYVPHRTQTQELQGHQDWVYSVGLSPNSALTATGDQSGVVMVWDTGTGRRRYTLREHSRAVTAVEFSPDGRQLATASLDGKVIFHNAETGQVLGSLPPQVPTIIDMVWHPSGTRVAVGYGQGGGGAEWDPASRQQVRSLTGHEGGTFTVAYSHDGRVLFSGGENNKGFIWDTGNGSRLASLENMGMAVHSAFSGDDQLLYVATVSGIVNVYDRRSGQLKEQVAVGEGQGKGVAVARDARFLLTSTLISKNVQIIQERTWATIGRLHSLGFTARPRLSRDGRRLLIPDREGRILLADAGTGRQMQSFHGHYDNVNHVDFLGDGKQFVSASDDGTIRIWDAATSEELLTLIILDEGRDWVAVSPRGLFDGSSEGREAIKFRIGTGLQIAAVDRFFQDFYRPGIIGELVAGGRPLPHAAFAASVAPSIRITAPSSGGEVASGAARLTVEITDRGGGIKGPWFTHNGARVLVELSTVERDGGLQVTCVVPLIEGTNRLVAHAASADGSWESEPAEVTLNYLAPVEAAELFVLAVGISEYTEETMNLKYAAKDAEAIARIFRERGPELYGPERVSVRVLSNAEATMAEILKALAEIADQARPQDTLVLYMAGHGTMVGQRYYFLPHEFAYGGGTVEESVRARGIAGDALNEAVSSIPALKRVVIYDTCSSGGALALYRGGRGPFAFRQALEQMSRSTGSYCIAAAAATAEANEIQSLGHGVLTYSLLAAAAAVDAGPLTGQRIVQEDPVLGVRDWFNYAQDKVPLLTKLLLGSEQLVSYQGSGTNFPIISLSSPAPAPKK